MKPNTTGSKLKSERRNHKSRAKPRGDRGAERKKYIEGRGIETANITTVVHRQTFITRPAPLVYITPSIPPGRTVLIGVVTRAPVLTTFLPVVYAVRPAAFTSRVTTASPSFLPHSFIGYLVLLSLPPATYTLADHSAIPLTALVVHPFRLVCNFVMSFTKQRIHPVFPFPVEDGYAPHILYLPKY